MEKYLVHRNNVDSSRTVCVQNEPDLALLLHHPGQVPVLQQVPGPPHLQAGLAEELYCVQRTGQVTT